MKQNKVDCKEVMSHICDSLGEDLDSPKCVDIKTHLGLYGCIPLDWPPYIALTFMKGYT